MADGFDVGQQPNSAGLNQPDSGTYGEKAALSRLQSALPQVTPGPGSLPQPMGQPNPGGPGPVAVAPPSGAPVQPPQAPAGGLPSALLAPTARPGVPINTPLAQVPGNPINPSQTSAQKNLAILAQLAGDPSVSATTQQWAQATMQALIAVSHG